MIKKSPRTAPTQRKSSCKGGAKVVEDGVGEEEEEEVGGQEEEDEETDERKGRRRDRDYKPDGKTRKDAKIAAEEMGRRTSRRLSGMAGVDYTRFV